MRKDIGRCASVMVSSVNAGGCIRTNQQRGFASVEGLRQCGVRRVWCESAKAMRGLRICASGGRKGERRGLYRSEVAVDAEKGFKRGWERVHSRAFSALGVPAG